MFNFGKLFHFYFAAAFVVVAVSSNTGLNNTSEICPNYCECELNVVTCAKKQLTEVPDNIPTNTQVLNLNGNAIQNLSLNAFINLSNLSVLILSSNRIETIQTEIFNILSNLKQLELRDNRLTSVPVGLRQLTTLEKLDLRLNSINELKENDLIEISNVKVVDLAKNRIRGWPTVNFQSFNDSKLITLDLANNEIDILYPNAFRMFRKLTNLRLARNKLDKIERTAFGDSVKNLDLSRNRIRKIDSLNFASQSRLESVNLNRNLIDVLEPGAFHGVNNLQILNLSSNRLQFISEGLFGLSNLTKLDLTSNEFRAANEKMWAYVENLKWLSLSNNHITELTSYAFRPLNRLKHLSLSRNQLKSVSKKSFIGLSSLEELDMSFNELAVCVEDGSILQNTSLNTLKKLDFSSNLIATIPANAFQGFKNLQSLDISENPIATIFSGAFDNLHLKELKISTSVLICDCRITWFSPWLQRTNLSTEAITAKCDHPATIRGMDIRTIENSKLLCASHSPQSKITMQPLPLVIAQNGKDVHLHCKGYGASPLNIQWKIFENDIDRVMEEDSSLRIFINHTKDDENPDNEFVYSELLLRNVTVTDQAEYQCVVKNRHGSAYSIHSTLEIHDLPQFVVSPPKEIAALAGDTVWIPCKAGGIPEPVISYQKDMENMFNAAKEKRVYVADKSDGLYLLRVNKNDEGMYSCIATNDAGQTSATTKLMVFETGFTNTLLNTTAEEGGPMILFCRGSISIPFNIHWYINGTRIKPNNNSYGITFKGASNEMLVAASANLFNTGYYRCELRVTEKELLLQAQSAYIRINPRTANNAMYIPIDNLYPPYQPPMIHQPAIITTTTTEIIFSTSPQPTTTSTKETVTQLIISTQPQPPPIIIPKIETVTTTTRRLGTSRVSSSRSSTSTTTSSSIPQGNPGFFKIIYREFVKEYKSWSYPYQILLIFFVSFSLLFIVILCYCGVCLRICKRIKKRRQYHTDLRSDSFRADFNVTKHLVIQYQEDTSMSPSSTNSTSCTTYASLTPKNESEHMVEAKRPTNNKASLVKCI